MRGGTCPTPKEAQPSAPGGSGGEAGRLIGGPLPSPTRYGPGSRPAPKERLSSRPPGSARPGKGALHGLLLRPPAAQARSEAESNSAQAGPGPRRPPQASALRLAPRHRQEPPLPPQRRRRAAILPSRDLPGSDAADPEIKQTWPRRRNILKYSNRFCF